jgi:23S rRNA (guanosine2251-2'-O)-methyltransferase
VGAIIRSAYCAGADGIILPKKNAASLTPTAFKASAGLAEYSDIYAVGSTEQAILELKKAGYHIYLAVFNGKRADATTFNQPLCLVIGGEGSGISKTILSEGTPITIPQRTADISYNASVAAGILLFLVGSQIKRI